ncbi:MAG: hypothetical protein IKT40_11865 [Bacilli bacterium]|nr:hypothetical protein [Bacilli bacterium]
MEKYKYLNQASICARQIAMRAIKENLNTFESINNGIKLDEAIISDMLDLITNISDLTLEEFIFDIKKGNYCNRQINNKEELIYYIKKTYNSSSFLCNFISKAFIWAYTKKGHEFYQKLNNNINNKIGLNKILFEDII